MIASILSAGCSNKTCLYGHYETVLEMQQVFTGIINNVPQYILVPIMQKHFYCEKYEADEK